MLFRSGDSSTESNPELDALSKMVVDKVLERIKNQSQAEHSLKIQASKAVCDDRTGMAVNQMRHLLQRERNLVSELQVRFDPKTYAWQTGCLPCLHD